MGKIFLDHIGGTRLFSCASCDVNLTNRSELISTRFTGATGKELRNEGSLFAEVKEIIIFYGFEILESALKLSVVFLSIVQI